MYEPEEGWTEGAWVGKHQKIILNIRLISGRMEVGRRLITTSMLVDLMKQSPVLRSTFRIFSVSL